MLKKTLFEPNSFLQTYPKLFHYPVYHVARSAQVDVIITLTGVHCLHVVPNVWVWGEYVCLHLSVYVCRLPHDPRRKVAESRCSLEGKVGWVEGVRTNAH